MKHYPQPVTEALEFGMESFSNYIKEEKINTKVIYEEMGDRLLKKFIDGEPMTWTEDEVLDIMNVSLVNTIIEGLIESGYVKSIEDENGVEYIWATEKGLKETEK
jgi:hypothetical protein